MNKELAKTLTTALVQFIDRERPEGTMCCSNIECGALEEAFKSDNLDDVEAFIQKRLSRLTEFESSLRQIIEVTLSDEVPNGSGGTMSWAVVLSDDDIKKLAPKVLDLAKKELLKDDELGRKHLEGYCMGREDTLREMKDFIESHFNCENAKKGTPIVYNTQSGTATATLHGNTSATDGKEHNPSFTDKALRDMYKTE